MERSETLKRLRGESSATDKQSSVSRHPQESDEMNTRLPETFRDQTPENAQKIILWCLESDPSKRPTAAELLKVSWSFNPRGVHFPCSQFVLYTLKERTIAEKNRARTALPGGSTTAIN